MRALTAVKLLSKGHPSQRALAFCSGIMGYFVSLNRVPSGAGNPVLQGFCRQITGAASN